MAFGFWEGTQTAPDYGKHMVISEPKLKDAWNVPILGDPFAFFLDRCK